MFQTYSRRTFWVIRTSMDSEDIFEEKKTVGTLCKNCYLFGWTVLLYSEDM